MDATIAAALIGTLGAGIFGAFGFILTGLRANVRDHGEHIKANGERIGILGERVAALDERMISEFGTVKDVLARIEAMQTEHGHQFARTATDHTERIAALERAAGSTA